MNDEENIKDAKYLEDSMNQSSKAHWINGFEKHPDPKYAHCGPCEGLNGIKERMSNQSYISIGDHIVGPWFETQIENGLLKKEDAKHSYYMSRIVPKHLQAHSLTEQGCQPKFYGW